MACALMWCNIDVVYVPTGDSTSSVLALLHQLQRADGSTPLCWLYSNESCCLCVDSALKKLMKSVWSVCTDSVLNVSIVN